ncbi:MAG: YmdB family metallophosphoesterase [Proteobacteria bacterium]|nr:YmdB family metallophosphoesterase [Pseudomonadota bacterium]
MSEYTNILFIGDIIGRPGRKAIKEHLGMLKKNYKLDFVVVNAENSAGGYGITAKVAKELFGYGVDVLTLGDHTFDKPDTETILENTNKILRPINYPDGVAGKGFNIFKLENGVRIAVLSIMGRVGMAWTVDCPFQASKALQREYRLGEDYDILVIDSHTEATSESVCLGHVWDGKASMIGGSHTHIPTSDAFITTKGTLYQTDTGMTGVYGTSLGSDFHEAIKRFEHGRRYRIKLSSGEATLCGLYAKVDNETGKAVEFKIIKVGGVLPSTEG